MSTQNLVLFYQSTCPYCKKVLNFMEKNNVQIEKREIRKDKDAAEKLKKEGGKIQVPCLFIDGAPLYESDDIIQWLKDNLV